MNPIDFIHLADEAAAKSDHRIKDDVRSDCIIALYELAGVDDYEVAARKAIRKIVNRHERDFRERYLRGRVTSLNTDNIDVVDDRSNEPPSDRLTRPMTEKGRMRFERDLIIRVAIRQGVPDRIIARVLGVDRKRLADMREKESSKL